MAGVLWGGSETRDAAGIRKEMLEALSKSEGEKHAGLLPLPQAYVDILDLEASSEGFKYHPTSSRWEN